MMAGVEGLEPSRTVLETGMLPLHHTPKILTVTVYHNDARVSREKVNIFTCHISHNQPYVLLVQEDYLYNLKHNSRFQYSGRLIPIFP